jgi:hypothetical protein
VPHRVICAEGHPCSPLPNDLKKPGRGICRVCARKDPATARQNFDARVRELGFEPTTTNGKER